MNITWPIIRYARCYMESSMQCLDSSRINPIFQYFSHADIPKVQVEGHHWSVVNQTEKWTIYIELITSAKGSCELRIKLKQSEREVGLVKSNN